MNSSGPPSISVVGSENKTNVLKSILQADESQKTHVYASKELIVDIL